MSAREDGSVYVPGARMAAKRAELRRIGEDLFHAINRVQDLSGKMLLAMPTWADITATERIALGERCVVWGIVNRQAEEAVRARKAVAKIVPFGHWALAMSTYIPTVWDMSDSRKLWDNPESYFLTREDMEHIREERGEALARLESSARLNAGLTTTEGA